MSVAMGLVALVGVSAITPGPNNVAVMTVAAQRGFAGALPAIAGVVLGSLVMVAISIAGLGATLAAAPLSRLWLSVAGCAYLCYLGARMFLTHVAETGPSGAGPAARSSFTGLLVFQFLNPKGWAMVLTAVASAQAAGSSALATMLLVATFIVVPAACLAFWALSGALLSARLRRPRFRVYFDRFMGATLIVSALLLLIDSWQADGAATSLEVS